MQWRRPASGADGKSMLIPFTQASLIHAKNKMGLLSTRQLLSKWCLENHGCFHLVAPTVFNERPRPVCLSAWKLVHRRIFWAQACLGVCPLIVHILPAEPKGKGARRRSGTVIRGRRHGR